MTESRAQVDALLMLFDDSLVEPDDRFGTNRWHSMLGNLTSCHPRDWDALPPGAVRNIRELVEHVGGCYLVYENHAFGDRTRTWSDTEIDGLVPDESVETTTAWLIAAHRKFRSSVARLTDVRLRDVTFNHAGDELETRRIIELMIQHGLYHAGEINHLRCLLQGNDA